jgi:V8-like Glu-specific endopeptidase
MKQFVLTLIVFANVVTIFAQETEIQDTFQNYPLGNLLPYTPPNDPEFFSNEFIHVDLTTGQTSSSVLDTMKLSKEIIQEGYVPSTMANPQVGTSKAFGQLTAAYNYQDFPNYPMSAIVRIEMYDGQNNMLGTCSGAFINKNTVLSAAHCVHTPPNLYTNIANIKVVPAYDNGTAPYGEFWAAGFWIPNNWVSNQDWNYDLMVINMTGDPGLITGYLGWAAGDANTGIFTNSSSVFNTFGYPATTLTGTPVFDVGERMWHMQGYFDFFGNGTTLGNNVVYHYNQGFKGLSGSNTYLYDYYNRYVMAILSHGFDPPSVQNSFTGHVRLNSFLGGFINTYAPETILSIDEPSQEYLSIYPNPCKDVIHVEGLTNIEVDFNILDMTGKTVLSGVTNGLIRTEKLTSGYYHLEIDGSQLKLLVQ